MDASSSLDEFASADEFVSDNDGCFTPIGTHSRDAGKFMFTATQSIPEGPQSSQDDEGVAGSGRDVVSTVNIAFRQACRTEAVDAGAEADAEDDGSGSDPGSPKVDPLASKDLDSGSKVHLFKVYVIHDSISGAEWVVDGGTNSASEWSAVWNEKRVKDANTGSIASLQDLENTLVERVLAQFDRHRVKDLDTGAEIDLFEGIPRETVVSSVRKEMLVMDQDTGDMLSLAELQELLAPPQTASRANIKTSKRRRLKLKSKNVKRIYGKIATGLQAGVAGIQAGLEHVQDLGKSTAGPDSEDKDSVESAAVGQLVKVHRKQYKEFCNLHVRQQLEAHDGFIWAMIFSRDGQFLASGGQDQVVRVWEVHKHACGKSTSTKPQASSSLARQPLSEAGDQTSCLQQEQKLKRFLRERPHRQYQGHTAAVLDLSWSASNFLLSSSMDKTVRLWHLSVDGECLRVFQHTDYVTVVDFHPVQDKTFLSGSIDGKVRLWNMPSNRVMDFADCNEMVTAAAFSPEGDKVAIGTMVGKCRFYSLDKAKFSYNAQLDVCTSKARSRKITGVQYLPGQPDRVLVSSNDSRLRLYDMSEYSQCCKYKGHVNRQAQIKATFSRDGKYIICGSDTGHVFVWSTVNPVIPAVNPSYTGFRKDKNSSYEAFPAHEDMVTVALFAPGVVQSLSHRDGESDVVPATRAASALLHSTLGSTPGGDTVPEARGNSLEERTLASVQLYPEHAVGEVLLAACATGAIKVFESQGEPRWL